MNCFIQLQIEGKNDLQPAAGSGIQPPCLSFLSSLSLLFLFSLFVLVVVVVVVVITFLTLLVSGLSPAALQEKMSLRSAPT